MMTISHSHKFIFIHVYKVAGASITRALSKYQSWWDKSKIIRLLKHYNMGKILGTYRLRTFPPHSKARELRLQLPKKIYDNYFKFAFVRNPWEWQISLYHYMLEHPEHHQHGFIESFKNFDEYIDWRVNNEVRLQKDFVVSEKGKIIVDYIGKFENLQNDFDNICDKIGIRRMNLPHANKSKHKSYKYYYNERTKKMIEDAFREDIDFFNYKYDE